MIGLYLLGNQQYFFNGNHVGEHVCSCAEDNSCLGNGGSPNDCNCDANQPDWVQDSGEITAKDFLPITGFAYGPLEFDIEQANFTIGRLRCSGWHCIFNKARWPKQILTQEKHRSPSMKSHATLWSAKASQSLPFRFYNPEIISGLVIVTWDQFPVMMVTWRT